MSSHCKKCQRPIEKQATHCTHCGEPLPHRGMRTGCIILVLLFVIAFVLMISFTKYTDSSSPASKTTAEQSATSEKNSGDDAGQPGNSQ